MIKCAFRALLSCLGQFNHVARPVNVSMVLSIKDFSLIFSYMVPSLGSVAKKPNLLKDHQSPLYFEEQCCLAVIYQAESIASYLPSL